MARIPRGYNAGYDPGRRGAARAGRRGVPDRRKAFRAGYGRRDRFLRAVAWIRGVYGVERGEYGDPPQPAPPVTFWGAAGWFAICAASLWWLWR